jgi:anti-sigma B factor antagonist
MNLPPQFHAKLEAPSEQVAVVALEGDVDIYSAPQFKQILMRGIDQGSRRVIVDLSRATFLDSTGLGVLVSGAKRARKGALSIVCNDANMARIFEIVGLECIFVIYGTLQEAMKDALVPGEAASH